MEKKMLKRWNFWGKKELGQIVLSTICVCELEGSSIVEGFKSCFVVKAIENFRACLFRNMLFDR